MNQSPRSVQSLSSIYLILISRNHNEITNETLKNVKLFVLAGSHDKFTEDEFKRMKEFVDNGGSLLILSGEGGETEFNTNLTFLLEEYGMAINNGKCYHF